MMDVAAGIEHQPVPPASSFRRTLHLSRLAHVENTFVSPDDLPPSGHETQYQIVLPYYGLFAYHVGTRSWLVDATRTLCISPGRDFIGKHQVSGLGHAAILITLHRDLVDDVWGPSASDKSACFRQISIPRAGDLQILTHTILRRRPEAYDPLSSDEWVLHALRHLGRPKPASAETPAVVKRAKEILHAHRCERLSLEQIGKLVGVSPVYLTQEFTRSEGVPLYQYQLHLRLNRALLELPHCENITELALDLGFSSHSHFTLAFRKAFGVTPSKFRAHPTCGFDFRKHGFLRQHEAADPRRAA